VLERWLPSPRALELQPFKNGAAIHAHHVDLAAATVVVVGTVDEFVVALLIKLSADVRGRVFIAGACACAGVGAGAGAGGAVGVGVSVGVAVVAGAAITIIIII